MNFSANLKNPKQSKKCIIFSSASNSKNFVDSYVIISIISNYLCIYVFNLLLLFLPFTGLTEKPVKQVHFFLTFPSSELPKRIFRKIGIATLGI